MIRFNVVSAVLTCLLVLSGRVFGADPVEGKYYNIKCTRSELNLSIEEGEQIIQRIPGPAERQQWRFVKKGDYYIIINRKTEKAIKVKDDSKKAGTPVIQSKVNLDIESQHWSFVKQGDNIAIKSRHSGLVLDVAQGSVDKLDPLIQWPLKKANNGNQHFKILPVKQ
jgi:hypothetical protein